MATTLYTDSLFEHVSYDKTTEELTFVFAGGVVLISRLFWRVWKDGEVVFNTFDHFNGLSSAHNSTEVLGWQLEGQALQKIEVADDASYATAILNGEVRIEVFNQEPSMDGGYEFAIDGKRYRATMQGELVEVS